VADGDDDPFQVDGESKNSKRKTRKRKRVVLRDSSQSSLASDADTSHKRSSSCSSTCSSTDDEIQETVRRKDGKSIKKKKISKASSKRLCLSEELGKPSSTKSNQAKYKTVKPKIPHKELVNKKASQTKHQRKTKVATCEDYSSSEDESHYTSSNHAKMSDKSKSKTLTHKFSEKQTNTKNKLVNKTASQSKPKFKSQFKLDEFSSSSEGENNLSDDENTSNDVCRSSSKTHNRPFSVL